MLQLGILLITTALIGVDQLTKWLAVANLEHNDPITVIEGILSFAYTQNEGAAWNMFEGQRWILVGVTSLMLIGLLGVLLSGRFRHHKMANIGGVLVVAGGIGNLIDRVWRGYVVDFIRTDFMDFPIFNVADCFVVIGAITLFVYFVFIYSDSSDKKAQSNDPEQKVTVSSEHADDHGNNSDGGTTA